MKVKDIRKDLEKFADTRVYFNIVGPYYEDSRKTYVRDILDLPDETNLPYECYEILYGWGYDGWSDEGFDVVCFYTHGPGYLHSHWDKAIHFNPEYMSELIPSEKIKYQRYLEYQNIPLVKRLNKRNAEEVDSKTLKDVDWLE